MIFYRGLRLATAMLMALGLLQGTGAYAQYAYPRGYGGYGWGGWGGGGGGGGTVAGNAASGLGALAVGAGQYNINTAEANAVNTDTVMKWNEYMYASSAAAAKRERERIAGRTAKTDKARQEILDRLRDNPEARDIYNGSALNFAKEEIDNPAVYTRTLKAAKAKIGGKTIRQIPFQYASAGIMTSVHDLVANGPPPLLKDPKFDSDRAAIREVAATVRKDIDEDRAPNPEDLKKIREMVKAARTKLEADVPKTTKGYDEAVKYLKSVAGLTRMLEGPAMNTILSGAENRPDATLAELLEFMKAFNLRFGAAKSPEQREIYDSLYGQLVAIRKEVAPTPTAAGPTPNHAHAHDFFAGMKSNEVEDTPPPPKPPVKP